jgi:hypothetical protein
MQWSKTKGQKDKQCNGLKQKDKKTNNELKTTTLTTEN